MPRCSPYTLDAYERDLLRFTSWLEGEGGELTLESITPEQVRAHMHMLINRHLSTATVRRALYALGSFFGWAVRWGLVPTNPVSRVTVPRRERVRDIRFLSKRERAIIIAAADRLAKGSHRPLDQQTPLLVRLMLKTGLRRGEVLCLKWRDVDLERAELFVRYGKGRKSRRVPLEDADLLAQLVRLRETQGIGANGNEQLLELPVFVSTRGTHLAHSSFYCIFHRVLAVANLDHRGITPHSLRHTFGSTLCARGVPVLRCTPNDMKAAVLLRRS